jgi:glucose-6-phosphate 1-dehydrogenase
MSNSHADPCVLVIFGASGDLTRRKLLPALYNLAEAGNLPDPFAVLGVARPAIDEATFRAQMRERVRQAEGEPLDADKWARIEGRLHYVSGEFHDPQLFAKVKSTLHELEGRYQVPPHYLFYLAVPPDLFGTIARGLFDAGLLQEPETAPGAARAPWRRVIIEKPFGYDLASARALNAELSKCLRESQIFRIDHYLGKETVQNILAFRFANGIFEPIWNRRYVDHVQMTVAEEVGVESRGGYYDNAGALRDMVQNHMFQLLTLVAMEPPIAFRPEDIRDEKVKVLHAVQPLRDDDIRRHVVRAQYTGDRHGTSLAYLQEPNVAADSRTDTYVAMQLFIDNWRWAGVPFYLRTGKRLARRVTEIVVQFKCAPLALFRQTSVDRLAANELVMHIQPDEGISLSFQAKEPGHHLERLGTVTMDFNYKEYFKAEPSTGYETLLYDAMAGDQTLFHRLDMVEAGWQLIDPILQAWQHDTTSPLATYAGGTWGPPEADVLIEQGDRRWRN